MLVHNSRDLKECKIIREDQNNCVWALSNIVAKEFEVMFVCPTEANRKITVFEKKRDQRFSKRIR